MARSPKESAPELEMEAHNCHTIMKQNTTMSNVKVQSNTKKNMSISGEKETASLVLSVAHQIYPS